MRSSTLRLSIPMAILLVGAFVPPHLQAAPAPVAISSAGALQQALNNVVDGGTIELAGGTYAAPTGGWTIFPQGNAAEARSFTVQAAAGANVVLTGNGSTKILTVTTSKPITFQNITFSNGVSTESFHGGAASVSGGQVSFVSCVFDHNAANGGTGGGALWLDTSTVSFTSCTWTNNTTPNYGAGFSSYKSRVFIRDSQFTGNRSNVAGHTAFSTGGGFHAEDSSVDVATTRFEDNHAGYVGGAIYVVGGGWSSGLSTAGSDLLVTNCLFRGNSASRQSGTYSAPTTGGAIMMEDQVRTRIFNSRFVGNTANQGGALSSYRTGTTIQNCVFDTNQAVVEQGANRLPDQHGLGGAIILLSDDNNDKSTNNGGINRQSASLSITDTLIRGDGTPAGRQGGGMFVAGDLHSTFGVGVPKAGTAESNRANVTLIRVAFDNLATADALTNNGTGGALTGDFVNLLMQDSIVTNCSTSQNGGGVDFAHLSTVTLRNSTFSGNHASNLGGAATSFGGTLNVEGCNFTDNTTDADGGYGTAITTVDGQAGSGMPASDVNGTIKTSVFSGDHGLFAIYDGHNPGGAANAVQYTSNTFFDGATPFYTDEGGAKSVVDLNLLNILGLVKSGGGNANASSAPTVGSVLMLPPRIISAGAPGEATPQTSYVAYAASGGTAVINGLPQRANCGVTNASGDAGQTLTVGNAAFKSVPVSGAAVNISTRLSVGQGDNALIGGFFIGGSGPKRVIVRAIGPSLGIEGALQNPTLQLVDSSGAVVATNDDWRSTVIGGALTSSQAIDIAATGVAPSDDAESAIVATLDPGPYTAVVRGANDSTGVGLVDVFDLDAVQTSTLANISTRGLVQGGDDVLIAGFIYLGGSSGTKVVVRASGPSLQNVPNALADPTLEVVDEHGTKVADNDNYGDSVDAAAISRFGLGPTNPSESAILTTSLRFGGYTAVVRGANGTTGIALVDAYIFD